MFPQIIGIIWSVKFHKFKVSRMCVICPTVQILSRCSGGGLTAVLKQGCSEPDKFWINIPTFLAVEATSNWIIEHKSLDEANVRGDPLHSRGPEEAVTLFIWASELILAFCSLLALSDEQITEHRRWAATGPALLQLPGHQGSSGEKTHN